MRGPLSIAYVDNDPHNIRNICDTLIKNGYTLSGEENKIRAMPGFNFFDGTYQPKERLQHPIKIPFEISIFNNRKDAVLCYQEDDVCNYDMYLINVNDNSGEDLSILETPKFLTRGISPLARHTPQKRAFDGIINILLQYRRDFDELKLETSYGKNDNVIVDIPSSAITSQGIFDRIAYAHYWLHTAA